VADIPFELSAPLAQRLRAAVDLEGKIPNALETLGPLTDRRVGFFDVPAGQLLDSICARASEAVAIPPVEPLRIDRPDGSLDAIVSLWSGFRGVDEATLAEVDRVLGPNGRLLVVHDYGRDEVSALVDPDAPQYLVWSRRFWTFASVEDAQAFLGEAFGDRGTAAGASLRRPRLAWNVAVYHRWRGGIEPQADPALDPATA